MNRPPMIPGSLPSAPLSGEEWEAVVRQSAAGFSYPPTPDVSTPVLARLASEQRRAPVRRLKTLGWVAVLLLLMIGLWAVPPLRAAILDFLQVGAVRIWLVTPTPEPTAAPQTTLQATPEQGGAATLVVTPSPTATSSLFDLAGETTLVEAEARAGFAIPLPTYPDSIGAPDGVFYQVLGGPVVILVWMDPAQPGKAKYSLHILSDRTFAEKTNPAVVMTTTVNGNAAAWTQGPYILAYGTARQADWKTRYLVTGRVLIWQEDGLTYRLESNLSLEEAKRMAESLEK